MSARERDLQIQDIDNQRFLYGNKNMWNSLFDKNGASRADKTKSRIFEVKQSMNLDDTNTPSRKQQKHPKTVAGLTVYDRLTNPEGYTGQWKAQFEQL